MVQRYADHFRTYAEWPHSPECIAAFEESGVPLIDGGDGVHAFWLDIDERSHRDLAWMRERSHSSLEWQLHGVIESYTRTLAYRVGGLRLFAPPFSGASEASRAPARTSAPEEPSVPPA